MQAALPSPSWKQSVLPSEHGVWGLLAGAALVGLPLGGDGAGLGLLVAALAGVVARQAARAWEHGARRSAGTALLMAGLAGAAGVAVTWMSARTEAWLPWAVAMALAGVAQVVGSRLVSGRPWLLSVLGGLVFALLAGAVAAAGGAPASWAAIVVVVLAAHFATMVPLVRAQTRREARWPALAIDLSLACLLAAMAAWAIGLVPGAIPLLFGLGLVRSMVIVDKGAPMSAISPIRIGTIEMLWLAAVAAGVVLGLRAG